MCVVCHVLYQLLAISKCSAELEAFCGVPAISVVASRQARTTAVGDRRYNFASDLKVGATHKVNVVDVMENPDISFALTSSCSGYIL